MLHPLDGGVAPVGSVGGKAASLMKLYSTPGLSGHVPSGVALSADFFGGWVEQVMATDLWAAAVPKLQSPEAALVCSGLKEAAVGLPLSEEQAQVLERLRAEILRWPGQLAAVRSSAPEEDGAGASFAGVFETRLGITAESLEAAVRHCFASVFDHRVFSYTGTHKPAFAAVVMQMVDSYTAGVAFSANPLNSDLDEMLVDSSWGLGESVVDGSVVADRFLWDKAHGKLIEKAVGKKAQERRLGKDGGVEVRALDEAKQRECTLSDAQVKQLAELVCLVERTYGVPMDVEWAHTEHGELKLLQARPITTIHLIDEKMITPVGQPRVLYYDFNIASEATTTSPFTHMDLACYTDLYRFMIPGLEVPEDPRMFLFNGETRQFVNFSHVLKFVGPGMFISAADTLDPYLASLFRSDDLNRSRYRTRTLPQEINCCSGLSLLRKLWGPARKSLSGQSGWSGDLAKAKAEYEGMYRELEAKMDASEDRGAAEGLVRYWSAIWEVYGDALWHEMGAIAIILPIFNELNQQRTSGKTEKEREEADALLGGYDGDMIMETNIAMYNLARWLPDAVWHEYRANLGELAARIAANLDGAVSDLPRDFLEAWKDFIRKYGYDGADQLFVSSPRYVDTPENLLARLLHNVGDSVKDPAELQQKMSARRREVMASQEAAAGTGCCPWRQLKRLKQRNQALEHLMSMRNTPKLHLARIFASIRAEVLKVEGKLLEGGRLDEKGDVFHLTLQEVDEAVRDPSYDLRTTLAPRKARYARAKRAKVCPMLVDSRCRILKPNVVKSEPGTLVGAAISPGAATGRVRVVGSPTERLEAGEVLVAVVTDPAWTPLFAGAAAVVMQVGGALQHGALCAREYGKPAVSGIDVMAELETGMLVEVDGNTGTVKILKEREGLRKSSSLRALVVP